MSAQVNQGSHWDRPITQHREKLDEAMLITIVYDIAAHLLFFMHRLSQDEIDKTVTPATAEISVLRTPRTSRHKAEA